ncbi:dolichol-phosphate mannosyltransferase subunit 3 [Auriscalpium vulgare]|uniref:Dolichol-phosphate mannosyltransferase subunit 3 n=1 Tax=Auriscalpium vulgare TaxID=40419 RepID=A0ACB8S2D2_9AGAM|nr:dolichol-phosphate mannosyltransferase subunit 3 [Auriscalpium vulgare]
MTRATRVAAYSGVVSIAYFLTFFQYLPMPLVAEEQATQILVVLPWWLLVSFGSYALWSLGHGLYTFRECTDAYTELLTEISQAKSELRIKGVSVD